ncbi:MAG TPA: ATPase, partial [Synergistaceae bacterium]|nr:ATPase [Synergistaceae bacterium]
MAALQEVLAVLLGAEGEARSEIEESRNEAERVVRRAKDAFSQERERRLAAAREQAKAVLDLARSAADAEGGQILQMGQQDLDRMRERFDENVQGLVAT